MTQLKLAKKGKISPEMLSVAYAEECAPESVRNGIAKGHIVIPKNKVRNIGKLCGIGRGLKTKVNANIGTSKDSSDTGYEIKKMDAAVSLGADTIMDLSTGPGADRTLAEILKNCKVPLGTVPLYEIVIDGIARRGSIDKIKVDDMFAVIESQARAGVDFFTIHAGVTRKAIEMLRKKPRVLDIVSRGGAFLAEWMITNKRENPFYEYFERVIDIAAQYDVTLSLGDGLRPGAIADANDGPQIAELRALGQLQRRALRAGVQVVIEGPGHVPMQEIKKNVVMEKRICNGAPFYVLGPLVTDIAPGYDHITAAIGGAIAGSAGADFLCYVTPAEHLRLPTIEDVAEGVVASKIAAHAADIAKGVKGSIDRDIAISRARRARDWKKQFELSIDSEKPKKYRKETKPSLDDVCTMCGEYCSIKVSERCLKS